MINTCRALRKVPGISGWLLLLLFYYDGQPYSSCKTPGHLLCEAFLVFFRQSFLSHWFLVFVVYFGFHDIYTFTFQDILL